MADINRSDVAGLIPTDYSNDFLDIITAESAVLSNFTTVRVGTKVTTFPVLSALPSAGFVTEQIDDAAGTKPTTDVAWRNKTLTVEEVACIVPIHENVIEDSTVDLWAQIRPLVGQAFGQVIDNAVIWGIGKPSSWRAGIVPAAKTAGAVATLPSSTTATNDLLTAFSDAMTFIEADGNNPELAFVGPRMRGKLRKLRESTGAFLATGSTGAPNSAAGPDVFDLNLRPVKNAAWSDVSALSAIVDPSKIVLGLRSDMSYKLLTEATVNGINLAEKDMVALRIKMRLGWEVADNANALSATPLPYAVVAPYAGTS
jgi:HK97 family phage major capsid protein